MCIYDEHGSFAMDETQMPFVIDTKAMYETHGQRLSMVMIGGKTLCITFFGYIVLVSDQINRGIQRIMPKEAYHDNIL